jgi:hypothetical protein
LENEWRSNAVERCENEVRSGKSDRGLTVNDCNRPMSRVRSIAGDLQSICGPVRIGDPGLQVAVTKGADVRERGAARETEQGIDR